MVAVTVQSSLKPIVRAAVPRGKLILRAESNKRRNILTSNLLSELLSQQHDKETFCVPAGIKEIDAFCFYGSGVKKVYISESVKNIDDYAFAYCRDISEITFAAGSKLHTVGKNVFRKCNNLALVLPEGLASIGKEWFKESGIKEVRIPASVQSIGYNSF